ncbi:MAG: hypothetical protein H6739_18660 [Alphaproteobacteria bacterium]|nr:hypothetical protein [Alphaproteobacteria bacterium]
MSYPSDRLHEEVAYLSYYLHWPYESVMAMDHLERQRWVREVARMNEDISRANASGAAPSGWPGGR